MKEKKGNGVFLNPATIAALDEIISTETPRYRGRAHLIQCLAYAEAQHRATSEKMRENRCAGRF